MGSERDAAALQSSLRSVRAVRAIRAERAQRLASPVPSERWEARELPQPSQNRARFRAPQAPRGGTAQVTVGRQGREAASGPLGSREFFGRGT
jgi:hypothetical protein